MTKIYIAGPMTGIKDYNHPAFNHTADSLRRTGFLVRNPAEIDNGSTNKSWDFYMRHALRLLLDSDEVMCLYGWERSRGARLEVTVALTLGMSVWDDGKVDGRRITCVPPLLGGKAQPPPAVEKAQETVLQEADRLVAADRQDSYGHPFDDFTRTGKMWAAILDLTEVKPEEVALCMVALKISRECHKPKRDNRVDGAGYFKCLDLVAQVRGEGGK